MSTCKQCGLTVEWRRVDGRPQCFNPDGSIHWDLCSKTKFERIKREGEFFDQPMAAGYIHPSKLQYTRLNAEPIRGKKYRPDRCDCGLPPWELCKPDCSHAIGVRRNG